MPAGSLHACRPLRGSCHSMTDGWLGTFNYVSDTSPLRSINAFLKPQQRSWAYKTATERAALS